MSEKPELTPGEKMQAALPADDQRKRRPWLVILTGLMTTFLVLGCCLCGGGLWWFRPQIDEDPDRAAALRQEMLDIQIPDEFQPKGSIKWNIGVLQLRGVYYERFVGDGILTLVEVDTRLAADDRVRRHIRETLLDEGAGGTHLVVDNSETFRKSFEIRGEPIEFTFETARDPVTNRSFRLVEGAFEGKQGQVLLHLRVDAESWRAAATPAQEQENQQPLPAWVTSLLESIGDALSENADDESAPKENAAGAKPAPDTIPESPLPEESSPPQ